MEEKLKNDIIEYIEQSWPEGLFLVSFLKDKDLVMVSNTFGFKLFMVSKNFKELLKEILKPIDKILNTITSNR